MCGDQTLPRRGAVQGVPVCLHHQHHRIPARLRPHWMTVYAPDVAKLL